MGRSPEDVMLRFDFKVTRLGRKRGSWTRSEDLQLVQLVEEYGQRWTQIGRLIGVCVCVCVYACVSVYTCVCVCVCMYVWVLYDYAAMNE
mmetsp:Transcript_29520/g.49834  ORF Transcript_29520/g.49834 Transcript_29520/m.49834 type:complete len:90 (+) Transcript_29520:3169-3438(+)